MKPKKRQKLCHNCEGEIDIDVIVCPFCAADLREEKPEQGQSFYSPSTKHLNQQWETMQSLYPPPYKPAVEPSSEEPVTAGAVSDPDEETKSIFAPTLLFTLGVQLFLFGILILLFSHKGIVILKWDARFWFLYIFFSIPCLIFGYKSLSKL